MNKLKILVGIPAVNEEKYIDDTIRDLLNQTEEVRKNWTIDFVLFDDFSTDATAALAEKYPQIEIVRNKEHLGYCKNLFQIYAYMLKNDYDILVLHDGDGQHRAGNIEKMVSEWIEKRPNLIISSRFINGTGYKMGFARRVGKFIFRRLLKFKYGKTVKDPTSGNLLFDRATVEKALQVRGKAQAEFCNFFLISSFLKRKIVITEIPGEFIELNKKKGMHSNLLKSISFFVKNIYFGLTYK